jgi:hypothetical protein
METGEPVALPAVILLKLVSVRLALHQRNGSGDFGIASVMVGVDAADTIGYRPDKGFSGGRTTITADPPEEISSGMIQHFPEPENFSFFNRK